MPAINSDGWCRQDHVLEPSGIFYPNVVIAMAHWYRDERAYPTNLAKMLMPSVEIISALSGIFNSPIWPMDFIFLLQSDYWVLKGLPPKPSIISAATKALSVQWLEKKRLKMNKQ